MVSLQRVEHFAFDLESRQVFVAVDHEHGIIIEKRLDKHVILGDVDEICPASEPRPSIVTGINLATAAACEVSYQALELFDAAVVEEILGCILIRNESLQQCLVANEHVDEVLAQVLGLELLAAKVEEKRPPDRELGGPNLYHGLELVSDHFVALLVADSDNHFDVLLVDRIAD